MFREDRKGYPLYRYRRYRVEILTECANPLSFNAKIVRIEVINRLRI